MLDTKPKMFFIDLENVSAETLCQLGPFTDRDTIVVCYSDNAPKMPCAVLDYMTREPCTVSYVWMEAGYPNAVDFQIVALALHSALLAPEIDHAIVSADRGYEYAIVVARRLGVDNIRRLHPYDAAKYAAFDAKTTDNDSDMSLEDRLMQLGIKSSDVRATARAIRASHDKQSLNQNLVHMLDHSHWSKTHRGSNSKTKHANVVYNCLKPQVDQLLELFGSEG